MLNTQVQKNDFTAIPPVMTDSRKQGYDNDTMWDQLNLSQQYAVCSLGQFGYLLTYVRSIAGHTLAILKQDNKVATVNAAGMINVNPTINCR